MVLEVKNRKGVVKAAAGEKWRQEISGRANEFGNASLQSLRTSGMLLQILEKEKINKWPIHHAVVFANEKARILKGSTPNAPQTDTILKSMVAGWISENSSDEIEYRFTSEEFERVKSVICQYTSDYVESV